MPKLIKEETLHIDYPDISESVVLNYKVIQDNIGRICFKFYAESGNDFVYDEVATIGKDENDYFIISDTTNQPLVSAVQNTAAFIVSEYA